MNLQSSTKCSALHGNTKPSFKQNFFTYFIMHLLVRSALIFPSVSTSSKDICKLIMLSGFFKYSYASLAAPVVFQPFCVRMKLLAVHTQFDSDFKPHLEDHCHGILHHQSQQHQTELAPSQCWCACLHWCRGTAFKRHSSQVRNMPTQHAQQHNNEFEVRSMFWDLHLLHMVLTPTSLTTLCTLLLMLLLLMRPTQLGSSSSNLP